MKPRRGVWVVWLAAAVIVYSCISLSMLEEERTVNDFMRYGEVFQENVYLHVLVSAEHSRELLYHFVMYYREVGIDRSNMLFIVHTGLDHLELFGKAEHMRAIAVGKQFPGDRAKEYELRGAKDIPEENLNRLTAMTKDLLRYGVPVSNIWWWVGKYTSCVRVSRDMEMLKHHNVTQPHQWIVPLDSDEFYRLGRGAAGHEAGFLHVLRSALRSNANFVKGVFRDRVSADGSLRPILRNTSLSQQFPLRCYLTKFVAQGKSSKVMAYRADHRREVRRFEVVGLPASTKHGSSAFSGHHGMVPSLDRLVIDKNPDKYCPGIPNLEDVPQPHSPLVQYGQIMRIDHYKWDAHLHQKLVERRELLQGLKNAPHWTESDALLRHLEEHGGKICVDCEELDCKIASHRDRARQKQLERAHGDDDSS